MSNEQDPKHSQNEQDPKHSQTTEKEPKPSNELASEELDQIVGGTEPNFHDFSFTHYIDKSSPIIHQ